MATATIKFVPASQIALGAIDGELVRYYGTITFSAAGDAYAAGGLLPASGFDLKSLGPYADRTPVMVNVLSRSGSGWAYEWNNAAGKLKIFSGNSSGSATTSAAELTAVALNTTTPQVATDDIVFEAIFARR